MTRRLACQLVRTSRPKNKGATVHLKQAEILNVLIEGQETLDKIDLAEK
jgi:hypothetical protein